MPKKTPVYYYMYFFHICIDTSWVNLWKTLWKGSNFVSIGPILPAGYPTLFTPGEGGGGYECPLISFNYASESDPNEFSMNMSMSNET